jgi:hopene-associated glycosyltransferase HpnB
MDLTWLLACLPGALIWLAVLLLPWRPWSTRERLQPSNPGRDLKPGELTVLIPARNEAAQIGRTLNALRDQIGESQVVLVDDQSDDGTAEVARNLGVDGLEIVDGVPMPAGWTGKLWALHQGLERVTTPRVLLLDADIEVGDGVVSTLLGKMDDDGLQMASVMARLSTSGWWEKLLLPAFVYFFKLLYPFRLANDPRRRTAAAAGGCVLLETEVLRSIGGFTALKNELIDDCALAARIKDAGHRTWVGLSNAVVSHRRYGGLRPIWEMVARTAYTQLHYSPLLLVVCVLLLVAAFCLPVAGLALPSTAARIVSLTAFVAMMAAYLPTLRFYRLSPLWAPLMPLIGTLYLGMTIDSAVRYHQGRRSAWRDRVYST